MCEPNIQSVKVSEVYTSRGGLWEALIWGPMASRPRTAGAVACVFCDQMPNVQFK